MISRTEAKTIWELKEGDLISPWPGGTKPVVFMRCYSAEDRRGQKWEHLFTAVQGRGRYYCVAVVDDKGMSRDHHVCADQINDLRYVVHNRDT